jgi:hypothetical protein
VLERAGFKPIPPRGAYYVMTDISGFGFPDDVAFARWLVAEGGVAAVPGSSFYSDPRPVPSAFASISPETRDLEAGRRTPAVPAVAPSGAAGVPYPGGSTHMLKSRRSSLGPFGIAMALSAAPGLRFRSARCPRPTTCAASSTCSRRCCSPCRTTTSSSPTTRSSSAARSTACSRRWIRTHVPAQAARGGHGRELPGGVLGHRRLVRHRGQQDRGAVADRGHAAYRLGIRAGDKIVQVDGKP